MLPPSQTRLNKNVVAVTVVVAKYDEETMMLRVVVACARHGKENGKFRSNSPHLPLSSQPPQINERICAAIASAQLLGGSQLLGYSERETEGNIL